MTCIYCSWHDGHTDACPMTTGVRPVLPGEFPWGLRCCACSDVIDDVYVVRTSTTGRRELVCVGCDLTLTA